MTAENEELFKSNLSLLKKICSNVSFSEVNRTSNETGLIEVRNNLLFRPSKKGQPIALQSIRDPEAEAKRQCTRFLEEENISFEGTVAVFGLLNFRVIKQLAVKMKPRSMLLVIDAIPEVFKKMLFHFDLHELMVPGYDLVFIVSSDLKTIRNEFTHYMKNKASMKFSIFEPPSIKRAYNEFYAPVKKVLVEDFRVEVMNRSSNAFFCEEWHRQTIKNLPYIISSPPVDIFRDCFKGKTAIVAAAGPSLDISSEYIKKNRSRIVLFSVGTALKPLLNKDIKPDFVVSLDSSKETLDQFKDTASGKFFLLASPVIPPALVQRFHHYTAFYSICATLGFNSWLKSINCLPQNISTGGTVALSAIDCARFTGCSKVLLAGVDLAFSKDGTTHASNSIYHGIRMKKETAKVRGNYEREVLTSWQFSTYITIMNYFLEEKTKQFGTSFININDRGAELKGTSLLHPDKLESLLADEDEFDATAVISSCRNKFFRADSSRILEEIDLTEKSLERLSELSATAVEICDKTLNHDSQETTDISTKLEATEQKMRLESRASMLIADTLDEFMNSYLSENCSDCFTENMEKNREFYINLNKTAKHTGAILSKSRDSYLQIQK